MKYQAIKHLKTKSKVLGFYESLQEAIARIRQENVRYEGRSYIGGFPTFRSTSHTYSIQGFVPFDVGSGVVCSLPEKEVENLDFDPIGSEAVRNLNTNVNKN